MAKSVIIPTEENSDSRTHFKDRKCFRKSLIAVVSVCALILVITVLIVTIILLKFKHAPSEAPIYPKQILSYNEHPTDNLTLPGELKIVSRLEWLAQPPVQPPNPLATPVPYVIIHHTATESCSSREECVFHVRSIQTFHIESRIWWDIGYNFLVGGDGEAYEGRGWKAEGAHTYGYNAKSIGIAFIGTFNSFKPPQRQITACKQLIAKGVKEGYIRKDYKLLAARQLQTTHSPGAALYEDMKTWDHWAKAP